MNAMDTLSVVLRCCLEKNIAGWEAMELFAGGISESDTVFLVSSFLRRDIKTDGFYKDFVGSIETILSDETAPAEVKHRVLQLANIFACSINQLSPGAYLLQKNFFPPLVKVYCIACYRQVGECEADRSPDNERH